MGRPLNKKYFANKNTNSTNTSADDGIGGSTITGINVTTAGTYTSASLATLTFTEPALKLLGGVTATGTPTYKAVSATVSGSQSGTYVVGQLLTVATAGGTAIFRVATLTGSAVATVDLGTGADAGSFTSLAAGAQVTTVNTGTGTGALLTIQYGLLGATMTDSGSGYLPATVGTASIISTAATTTASGITSSISNNVLTVTAVTGTITNGMILTGGSVTAGTYIVNQLTSTESDSSMGKKGTYAIEKFGGGVINAGTPTAGTLNAITVSTTLDMIPGMTFTTPSGSGLTGTGLSASTTYYIVTCLGPTTVQVGTTYGATSAVVTAAVTLGSAVSVPFGQNLGVTVGGAGTGAATPVLSTIVNDRYSSVNVGIRMTAFLAAEDGGKAARQLSDITKQVSGTRYKVENQDGVGIVRLIAGAITAGTGIITATDFTGSTYYVTKLTGRKATLSRKASAGSGYEFAEGSQVQWTLSSAVTGVSVSIDNG